MQKKLYVKIPPPSCNWMCGSKGIKKEVEEVDDECPICFGTLLKTLRVVTPCGHIFHATCFNKLTHDVCPMCRKIFT